MFRERILSQVNVILQSVESIVSQLQEVSQYPNDQEQFWWDCQDVQSQCQSRSPDEDFENCSKLSHCAVSIDETFPLCSDDNEDDEDEGKAEVHHALLRAFVEADPEQGGVVTRQSFAHLLDTAADVLAAHGDCAYT